MPKETSPLSETREDQHDYVLLAYFDALAFTRKVLGNISNQIPYMTPPTLDEREREQTYENSPWMCELAVLLTDCYFDQRLLQKLKNLPTTPADQANEPARTLQADELVLRIVNLLRGGITDITKSQLRQDRTGSALLTKVPGWKARRRTLLVATLDANPEQSLEKRKQVIRDLELAASVRTVLETFPITADDRKLLDELFIELCKTDKNLVAVIAVGSTSAGGRVIRQLLGSDRSVTGEYTQVGDNYQDIDFLPIHTRKPQRTNSTIVTPYPSALRLAGLTGEMQENRDCILEPDDLRASIRRLFRSQVEIVIQKIFTEDFVLYDFFRPIAPREVESVVHETLLSCLRELANTEFKSWYIVTRLLIIKHLMYHRLKDKHFDTKHSRGEDSSEVTTLVESSPVAMVEPFLNILRQTQPDLAKL
ncbi:MAG: hypothetical protein A3A82_02865 [Candidatus Pacebacteria bacterium RIFCSPLOWO2_01_FULL_47_12]|nr:MAG: hypothetical protein A3A82_02865 [Candidatus Pacebacteria bacterium RIFCSPLOWO2_01_FULL_47_12]